MLKRRLYCYFSFLLLSACQLYTKCQIDSHPQINHDSVNRPLPVRMKAYLLQDDKIFSSASYEQLQHADQRVLGQSLVASQTWIQQPNQRHQIVLKPKRHARFLAVVAFFRNPSLGQWRIIKRLSELDMSALNPHQVDCHHNTIRWS